ncbi:ATP-binding protein [Methylobacterium aquaticum]|uniref:ATP-binding protein n=1 Tax=Methylobacterium aquaticum TaxID=270351 RepID=UPI0019321670|nr:ATP-binding protein [Methylobacterium aquaticum]
MNSVLVAYLKAGISSIAKSLWLPTKRQLMRRGAEQGLTQRLPELDEALDVLSGGAGVVGGAIASAKALASDLPSAFREDRFQRWAADTETRAVLRKAAIRRSQGLDVYGPDKKLALKRYAEICSDAQQRADRPFDDAVTFLSLTIRSAQTAGERVAEERGNADRTLIVNAIETGSDRIDATLIRLFEGGEIPKNKLVDKPSAYTAEEFASVSGELLSWPGDIGGIVIPRPELIDLEQRLVAPVSSALGRSILLFGPPGSGKSALLASLGNRLRKSGNTVLGIKADALPITVSSLAELGPALDLGPDIVEAITSHSTSGPVYILIDQLDAVASLIDGSGGRLRALSALAKRLRAWPEIKIVVSVRPFEFIADGGFRAAFPADTVERIDLVLPERNEINNILSAFDIDPAEIPTELDEIIRVPQALRDIVAARQAGFAWGVMKSWRSTQALRFERLVATYPNLGIDRLIGCMVDALRDTGTLWLANGRLPLGITPAIDRLCAEGILRRSDDGNAVGFAHQTWAETLDARLALADGGLTKRVIEASHNLMARPHALAVLRYARETSTPDYNSAITSLWCEPSLRRHLQHLILDLSAGNDAPTSAEQQIVVSVLASSDAALAERALRLSAGKAAWFDILYGLISDRMLSDDETHARSVWPWVSAYIPSHSDRIVDLLGRNWRNHPAHSRLIPNILEKLVIWDDFTYSLFKDALFYFGKINVFVLATVRHQAQSGRHDVAATLLGLILNRVADQTRDALQDARSENEDISEHGESDLFAAMKRFRSQQDRSFSYRFARELRELHGLHDLPEIVRNSPEPYARTLVTFFRSLTSTAAEALEAEDAAELQGSNITNSKYDISLVEALRVAVTELVRTNIAAFSELYALAGVGNHLLDRVFASAFASNVATTHGLALEFLSLDASRLRLGDRSSDEHCNTLELMKELSNYIGQDDNDRLVDLIRNWDEYEFDLSDDVRQRRMLRYGNRRLRARLLNALNISRLSTQARRFVQEELRAVPADHRERFRSVVGWVQSPMSTDAMERASDTQIINLFRDLSDEKDRWISRGASSLIGGMREASMAFGELAKRQPERVQKLLGEFSPSTQQEPVGYALRALSECASVDPFVILGLVSDALKRGFGNKGFRADVVWTLHNLTNRMPGLSDDWIKILVSWIEPPQAKLELPGSVSSFDKASADKPLPTTVLFESGSLRILPGGENSVILRVCTLGYLRRNKPSYSEFINLLENHLARDDAPETWAGLGYLLPQLAHADSTQANNFLTLLMRQQPEFRDSEESARVIARMIRTVPGDLIDEVLECWINSEWPLASVAVGEIRALRTAIFQPHTNADEWPAIAQASPVPMDTLTGVANVAVSCWNEDDLSLRTWARRTLALLATYQNERVAQACGNFFLRISPWPAEADTRRLLEIFSENPVLLKHAANSVVDDRLSDILNDFLSYAPIFKFMKSMIKTHKYEMSNYSGYGPMMARGLIPIVITLHRENMFREKTLDLFEDILDVLPDEAEGMLQSIIQ